MAVKDENEKNRKLTQAEEKRLKEFNEKCDKWVAEGYKRTDLTVGIVKANVFAILLFIPFGVVFGGLFYLFNRNAEVTFKPGMILFWVFYIVAIVVHEAIHGLSWAANTPNGMKDIEFGIMWQYLTPYATCKQPLKKGQYIFGALMPLVALGIFPSVISIPFHSFFWLAFGILMSVSAGGDILIVLEILKYKAKGKEVFYMDHPTQAGGVIFEK